MEAWRQRRTAERKHLEEQNEIRIDLTPTGLLMEGFNTQNACLVDILSEDSDLAPL